MKKTAKEKMVRKTYHLPEKVTKWVEKCADVQERSSSNFLSMVIKEVMKECENGK